MKKLVKKQNNRGITLVVLAIIIIVLLILVSVSIVTLTGLINIQGSKSNQSDQLEEGKLAKDVLTIDSGGNQENAKSQNVKYNSRLCRVLYNDKEHGLQIITTDSVVDVTLGSDNFEEAKNTYNNAVDILNNKAKEYLLETDKMESTANKIAVDARCLGSFPTKNGERFQGDTIKGTDYKNSYEYFNSFNKKLKLADENYREDANQLVKLGLTVKKKTWLASRYVYAAENYTSFGLRYLEHDIHVWAGIGLCDVSLKLR